ncbi:hypothetical protein OSTOST_09294 [Ostertagia ostertagi]
MAFAIPPVILYLTASFLILTCFFMGPHQLFRWWSRQDIDEKRVAKAVEKNIHNAYDDLGPFTKYLTDSVPGILIVFLMSDVAEDPADANRDYSPILTWSTMQRRFTWSCMLLIGAGYAISEGALSLCIFIRYTLAMPATVACSFAFMLPMATPPNAIVFDTKIVGMLEMVTTGVLLNICCVLITTLNMNTWTYWLFDLGTVPFLDRHLNATLRC